MSNTPQIVRDYQAATRLTAALLDLRCGRCGEIHVDSPCEEVTRVAPLGEGPIDTSFFDAVIAWCDGRGPLPPEAQEPRDG